MPRKEFPDRVAAIVDLMSHLFMLAVMLFILAIPFVPQNAANAKKLIYLRIELTEGAKSVRAAFDASLDGKSVQIDVRLDDGVEIRTVPESVLFLREISSDKFSELHGYMQGFVANSIVLIIRNADDAYLLSKVNMRLTTRTSEGKCDVPITAFIGKDAIYKLDLASCATS